MTSQLDTGIGRFAAEFSGEVFIPGQAEYDIARSLWNGAIDRRPAAVARCSDAAQVAAAIAFARSAGLEISVRGGAHNFAGFAACDGGLMIDLGGMRGVVVDPAAKRVVCGGGATWGDVDAATQEHGLAVPGGFISHTGIGGLSLGGGIGWLTKMAGLSCDNLVAAEVVTADSRVLRASATDNPDLFWALRGGGGNFGVVTSFGFALHEVGPMVNLALFFWGLDRGGEALRFCRDHARTLSADQSTFFAIAMSAPPEPFVPEAHRGATGHAYLVVGLGSAEEHAAAIAPVREGVPPLFELVTPIPYVALQQMFNDGAPWGVLAYEKALYLDDLTDAAIDVIGEHAGRKSSPMSFCPTFPLGGAYRTPQDGDTAFGGSRSAGFMFNISATAPTPELYAADRAWVRSFWEAMRPHASGSGSYVNFMSEQDDDRVRASYGVAKYERLARIKAEYDPDNVFHHNANIRPALQPA